MGAEASNSGKNDRKIKEFHNIYEDKGGNCPHRPHVSGTSDLDLLPLYWCSTTNKRVVYQPLFEGWKAELTVAPLEVALMRFEPTSCRS